jgi:hypothetical protein
MYKKIVKDKFPDTIRIDMEAKSLSIGRRSGAYQMLMRVVM